MILNKNQRGFTLLELMIAVAITGMIVGGITTTIFQMFSTNVRSSNHMVAVREVQKAGYWFSRDAQMAQGVVMVGVSGFPLTLTWTDWDNNEKHEVVYTLEDNKLQRSHSINESTETGIVAQYIAETNCEFTGGGAAAFSLPDGSSDTDEFTITDAVGGDSGIITVTMPGDVLKATPVGGATINGEYKTVTINIGSGEVDWATPVAGSMIIVTNTSNSKGTAGSWTATTGTATATISTDSDSDATLAAGGMSILTITATVQEESETRVYEVISRPIMY